MTPSVYLKIPTADGLSTDGLILHRLPESTSLTQAVSVSKHVNPLETDSSQ